MKEKYETPMMEMIEFNREEVVTMSGNGCLLYTSYTKYVLKNDIDASSVTTETAVNGAIDSKSGKRSPAGHVFRQRQSQRFQGSSLCGAACGRTAVERTAAAGAMGGRAGCLYIFRYLP